MRYIWQHIKGIIATYTGNVPLSHFLKNYFKQYPILGSRDRKMLSAMAYSWYRCDKGVVSGNETPESRIVKCLRLCKNELPKGVDEAIINGAEKIQFDINALFPFDIELSVGITKEAWLASMQEQPALFIRVRKDKGKLISLLNEHTIPFTFITDNCLSLPNGAKVDTILPPDTYVVQDASSQQTGSYFHPRKNELWYDCCSGAGGKSLLLKDTEPGVRLTVSDKRETIIYNLKQRFRQYRYEPPVAHLADVADRDKLAKALGSKHFDNIICDVPCTGSGTWARTPEQLYFFDTTGLASLTLLQKTIAVNASRYLKEEGRLIYITCSVFKKENEEVVEEIMKETGLELAEMQLINGVDIHADSMYVAVLRRRQGETA